MSEPLHFRVPLSHCECGKALELATPTDHDCSPEAGDLTVCLFCARPYQFGPDLVLAALTGEEELPPGAKVELLRVMQAIRSRQL